MLYLRLVIPLTEPLLMRKSAIALFLVICLMAFQAFGQFTEQKSANYFSDNEIHFARNSLKLRLVPFFHGEYSLAYEYSVNSNFSVEAEAGYLAKNFKTDLVSQLNFDFERNSKDLNDGWMIGIRPLVYKERYPDGVAYSIVYRFRQAGLYTAHDFLFEYGRRFIVKDRYRLDITAGFGLRLQRDNSYTVNPEYIENESAPIMIYFQINPGIFF